MEDPKTIKTSQVGKGSCCANIVTSVDPLGYMGMHTERTAPHSWPLTSTCALWHPLPPKNNVEVIEGSSGRQKIPPVFMGWQT